jgi:hypothetical protein
LIIRFDQSGENVRILSVIQILAWPLFFSISHANADGLQTCGLTESTIDARIQNCSAVPNSQRVSGTGVKWNLVARSHDVQTGKFYEVWEDSNTGLVWGDRLDREYTHFDAVTFGSQCHTDSLGYVLYCNVISETACESADGIRANVGIAERKFGLPRTDEYWTSFEDGILEVLPDIRQGFFWSVDFPTDRDPATQALIFDGYESSPEELSPRDSLTSVICVGR